MKRKILHVVRAMNQGGVETWLMHVLRHLDRERFQSDFLVHTDQPAAYDAELLALGARILRCPDPHNPLLFGKRFLEIANQFGPFDVIHSHVHHYSGFVLPLARAARIPVRIAHSHSDTRTANTGSAVLRKSYWRLSRRLIAANCTHGLAASVPAAVALYGPHWGRDPRVQVLHCGIDLDPFRTRSDRESVRSEFGFRTDDIVFGHVGSFIPVKNHAFLVEVAAEIVKREPRARFLLVGDGPLQPAVDEQLRRLGIRENVVFAGLRSDVPRLMMNAMDSFLFPSLYEGLPLVLMEAQAANLHAIISDTIALETTVIPGLIRRLSLRQSATVWAECALRYRQCQTTNALGEIERSPFNVITGVKDLEVIYGS